MKKLIVAAIAGGILAGCGTNLPKPVDPLKDTGVAPGSVSETADLRPYQNQPVGLLLSRNTRNLIQWQKKETDHSNAGFILAPLVGRADGGDPGQWDDPTGISTSAGSMLRAKFKNVALIQNLDAAASAGAPLVALLDIQAEESGCSSSIGECMPIMQTQYTLEFLNAKTRTQITAIRTIGSSGYCDLQRSGNYYADYSRCIREARSRALEALRTRLAVYLPDVPSRDAAATQAANGDGPVYLQRYEESRKTIEHGSPAEMYSLGLRMENSGNTALAGEVYQAIVRRYPDSPYAAKALERQEALVAH